MADNLLNIALSALVSGTVSAIIGLAIRESIGRKLDEAKQAVEEQRRKRIEYEEARCQWKAWVGRVLYHLVRFAQGRKPPNGDLDRAFEEFEKCENRLNAIERAYAAEAQVKE